MAKKESRSRHSKIGRWRSSWSASVPPALSRKMGAIRSKNTKPEMLVRRMVHAMGYRYRLHVRALPGTPDIVLPRHRKIIDVRGCFWHLHRCGSATVPSSRRAYWVPKLTRNRKRDERSVRKLRRAGWHVLVIWECQTQNNPEMLERRLKRFLKTESPPHAAKRRNVGSMGSKLHILTTQ